MADKRIKRHLLRACIFFAFYNKIKSSILAILKMREHFSRGFVNRKSFRNVSVTCQELFTWLNRIRLLRYAFILHSGVSRAGTGKSYHLMFRKHHFKTLLGKSKFSPFDVRSKQLSSPKPEHAFSQGQQFSFS